MKFKKYEREVNECAEKIQYLLKEFNCIIEWAADLGAIILVDKDTTDFEYLSQPKNL